MPDSRKLASLRMKAGRAPTYKGMLEKYQADRIPIGAMPPSPDLAWWYLSRRAKEELLRQRQAGRFGGIPGESPAWLIQEKGNAGSNVRARFYIYRAVEQWKSELGVIVKKWLGGYSFREQSEIFPKE